MLYQFLSEQFSEVIDKDKHTLLWSGCGEVRKMCLDEQNVVVKFSYVPKQLVHRHIQQSDFALSRKRTSYKIELTFYQWFHTNPKAGCQIPELIFSSQKNNATCLVLADFSYQGFVQHTDVSMQQHHAILSWLARFHSQFINQSEQIGWQQGGYWHLATRPDEWQRMHHHGLKTQAQYIDDLVTHCPYRCVIHGDAKVANFALDNHLNVIGYDFQYVGGGVGVQDVMLYFTSVFDETSLFNHADRLLEYYLKQLNAHLRINHSTDYVINVINSWRALWPVVWADFHRFLLGWKPDHVKINQYMLEHTNATLAQNRG
ncbi:hypothetical protein PSECIP111951_03643 [Pseudoalteromonas holothuriae]|uniref:CHK kinase-like domain-containing protein n=1 Tax=Pseudoalteromonas holothuriae TaxID=2963714 RepID=A0ABN8USP8_9GAMM|nr:kinase [Pseudoalteromonas sp. CIP111951]CAH9066779.1 hypothetical protein PSECIP111951_03643 [Pseudoalteromonas sp. CIP111951]